MPAPAGAGERRLGRGESGSSPRPTRATAASSRLTPEVAAVTNVELDHHSHWGGEGELLEAFARFTAPATALVRPAGLAPGGPRRSRVGPLVRRRRPTEPAPPAGLKVADVSPSDGGSEFTVQREAVGELRVRLGVPGRHNVANAVAAIGALLAARELDPGLPPLDDAGRGAGVVSRDGAAAGAQGGRPRAPSSTTTTPTIRPRSRPRWRRCASCPTAASSRSSSRTSTRGRRRSRRASAARSPPPTRSGCSTSTPPASVPRASSPGSAAWLVAEAAADAAPGPPVLLAGRRSSGRARLLAGRARRGRRPRHARRGGRLPARRRARRGRGGA